MRFRLIYFFFIFVLISESAYSQIGGQRSNAFLNLSTSARATWSGGYLIATEQSDIGLSWHNPALLTKENHQDLSVNSAFFPSGIQWGFVGYGHHFEDKGVFQGGIQFLNYGTIDRTTPDGEKSGTASAIDMSMGAGYSMPFEKYNFGANLKLVYSQIENYTSFGVLADFGATYEDTAGMWMVSAVFKNIGANIINYSPNEAIPMPFEIQMGFTKRLEHLPFRLHVMAHNLQNWRLRYDDPFATEGTFFGSDTVVSQPPLIERAADELIRHLVFGGEFYFGQSFRVGFGYNHQRRKELAVSTRKGLAGFSFGAGVRINRFQIYYGRGQYHIAGAANHISITTNINEFR